jgi:hypothetical protein
MTKFFPELVPENGGPSQKINAAMLIYRRFSFTYGKQSQTQAKSQCF